MRIGWTTGRGRRGRAPSGCRSRPRCSGPEAKAPTAHTAASTQGRGVELRAARVDARSENARTSAPITTTHGADDLATTEVAGRLPVVARGHVPQRLRRSWRPRRRMRRPLAVGARPKPARGRSHRPAQHPLVGSENDLDHVVPPGPAAARPPRPARGCRGRVRCSGCSSSTRPVGGRRAGAAGLAGRDAALARRVDGRPAVRAARAAPPRSCRGWPTRWMPTRCTSPTTSRPTAGPATRPWSRRCPTSVEGVATGTPYAVAPGSIVNGSGNPYKVFTPFSKAWRAHGWDDPVPRSARRRVGRGRRATSGSRRCSTRRCDDAPDGMPTPGEDAARRRFRSFLERDVDDYDDARDDPGADRTSRLSPYLKLGVVHPRQLLAETVRLAQPGGDDLRVRAGLARLLRRRAAPQPELGVGGPATAWPG